MRPTRSTKKSLLLCGLLALATACSLGVDDKHWRLAEEYTRQGQHRKAIEEYTRVVNFGGRTTLAVQAQIQIATIYEENLKNYNLAIRAYRDVVKRTEDNAIRLKARWAIARIYSEKMENPSVGADEYESLYKDLAQFQKDGPIIFLAWAKALTDAGRFLDSAKRYEEFRAAYPGHREGPRTFLDQGQAYLADRNFELGIKIFRDIVTKFSGNPEYTTLVGEAYYGLGSALEATGDLSSALEAYRQSLALYPNKKVIELKIDRVMKRKKDKLL